MGRRKVPSPPVSPNREPSVEETVLQKGNCRSNSHEFPPVVKTIEPMEPLKTVPSWIRELTEETVESFGVDGAERFVLRELLGEGGFGSVYRCSLEEKSNYNEDYEDKDHLDLLAMLGKTPEEVRVRRTKPEDCSGQDFAVKVVNARRLALISGCSLEVVCPKVQREIEILTHLGSHQRLVKLHYAFYAQDTARFYLVSELLRGGDLFSAIVRRGKPFQEGDARTILTQLVEAVAYCHSRHVAHRDLKLENCLLEAPDSLSVKVCDYGQSKFFGFQDQAKSLTTTPAYTAPEVKQAVQDDRPYDAYKADVFSLGVILYCLLCNAMPVDTAKHLYEQHRDWIGLSTLVKGLIGQLLATDNDLRPNAEEITQADWFRHPVASKDLSAAATVPTVVSSAEWQLAASEREQMRHVMEALISTQYVIDALQRERSSCCDPTLREAEFYWQMRYTDERFVEGDRRASIAESEQNQTRGKWQALQNELRKCASQVVSLRNTTCSLMRLNGAARPSGISPDEERTMVFSAYHPLLTRLITALANVLDSCHMPVVALDPRGSWRPIMRLRMMLLANEQLARERGYLAGHLKQPESLCSPPILLALAEIVGARKLLIGGAGPIDTGALDLAEQSQSEPHIVTAASGGLLSSLELTDGSLLEAADLSALARAEMQVLARHDGMIDQSAVSELYYLLLELADKVHQLMLIGMMELFSPPRTTPPIC
jgi:serine/threonine protein kinase